MDPKAFDRLHKLLEMTASDSDGEALNALRAAQRIMKEHGATWGALLGLTGLPRPSVQQPAPPRAPEPPKPPRPPQGMYSSGLGGTPFQQAAPPPFGQYRDAQDEGQRIYQEWMAAQAFNQSMNQHPWSTGHQPPMPDIPPMPDLHDREAKKRGWFTKGTK